MRTYFCWVERLAARADDIDDGEKFSCDVTDGHSVMFIHLMSVAVVNFCEAGLV